MVREAARSGRDGGVPVTASLPMGYRERISYPDGGRYAAAVFTRSRPSSDDGAISRAIGTAAARAVAALRDERP